MLWVACIVGLFALWIGTIYALVGMKRDQVERQRRGSSIAFGALTRRFLRRLWVPTVLLAVPPVLIVLVLVPKTEFAEWRYERLVNRAVPTGTSRESADAWLRSQGRVVSAEAASDRFDRIVLLAGESSVPSEFSGGSLAFVESTDWSLFVVGGVKIVILYDQEGRVAQRAIDWYGTGP